jgi:SAM-dependent methyltransferase
MTEKQMQVFFDIHRGLPREGPGSGRSTRRAFSMVAGLPPAPRILDVGCGPGAQTACLANLCGGKILAVDNHRPFLEQLRRKIAAERLTGRLPFAPGSFDLIWAEGSIYLAGMQNALELWRPLLKGNGAIGFTEVSWLRDDIPEEVDRFWKEAYPAIGPISRNLEIVRGAGYEPLDTFVLPESDWWNDYYDPILAKLPALREKYGRDEEAQAVLDMEDAEMALYRKYSAWYGYVFYLARREG